MFLFGCFVIALNAVFTQQLSLADEGYESVSDTIDLPTPLRKPPPIHHMSSMEHASFNPAHTTPHRTVNLTPSRFPQTPTRPVCHHLSFNSNSDQAQTTLQCTPTVQMITRIQTIHQHTQMRKKISQQYL